ncbi:MAG: ADP-ribosylglycohydrolase family protein [Trichodesmium sp. MO_231.B1]|nr:ADP-ribosylglycohydrolase family protein [Trichodesmium sp. MO_231.B1]
MSNTSTPILTKKRAIAIFDNYDNMEKALYELKDAKFNMDKVSIITRDPKGEPEITPAELKEEHDIGNKAPEGATTGALAGGALGGLTGLLVGLGSLAIPGVGPILWASMEATALATTLSGGAIGAMTGGLVGALVGLGIPEDKAIHYNKQVANGNYLIMVTGTEAEINHAYAILHKRDVQEWAIYDIPPKVSTTDK